MFESIGLLRLTAGVRWGLFCVDYADCESRGTGLEPLLGTYAPVCRIQSRLIQLRQGLTEATDACVVEVSRLMEAHAYGTGTVLQRRPRRVVSRVGKGAGRGEQNDNRRADDLGSLGDVERGGMKHVVVSFLSDGQGLARIVLSGGSSEPDMVQASRKRPAIETYNSLAFTK